MNTQEGEIERRRDRPRRRSATRWPGIGRTGLEPKGAGDATENRPEHAGEVGAEGTNTDGAVSREGRPILESLMTQEGS